MPNDLNPPKRLRPGDFVRVNVLGIGRFVGKGDQPGAALVEFLDTPGPEGRVQRSVSFDDILTVRGVSALKLQEQTRVWCHDGTRWLAGRVGVGPDRRGDPYFIAFPNGRTERLDQEEIWPRWDVPIEDPTRLLAARTVETRYFHQRRSRFVQTILDQRAACGGLGGLLASGVELHAHQLAAARRVLLDPIPRYLLADEVGLGKTIEAGMVIRQVLLDDAEADILVVAPEAITGQWRSELDSKFRVDQFGERVRVVAHEWLDQTGPVPVYGLVVVDEAHRLTDERSWPDEAVYLRLAAIATTSPRLLLLSATPVRSNEDTFLRMLHLLDPALYRLEDKEGFRLRIERRDEVAGLLSSLVDGTPMFLLDEVVERFGGIFPDDAILGRHLAELGSAIIADDEDTGATVIRALKTHVSETYRLHRRMIRTRRSAHLAKTFPVRHRGRPNDWLLRDPDVRRAALAGTLEAFASSVADEDVDQVRALRLVAGRIAAAPPALRALRQALEGRDASDFDDGDRDVVETLRHTAAGRSLAADLDRDLARQTNADRLSAMTQWAWSYVGTTKVAAFTDYPSVGRAGLKAMQDAYGRHRVAGLLSGMSTDELEAERARARDDDACVLLVCDRVAEEGWNLQFIDAVLHLDLPLSANRLEQRLGRFDRFADHRAARRPIQSFAFGDDEDDDATLGAWRNVLDEGFGIFSVSLASLQYVLPEYEAELWLRAVTDGLSALTFDLDKTTALLALARRRIDGQDLLDSLDDTAQDEAFRAALDDLDSEGVAVEAAADGWISGVLGFTSNRMEGGLRWGVSRRHALLLPENEVNRLGPSRLRQRYTGQRRHAAGSGAGFLRFGEPLINALLAQALRDDRGRAFASSLRLPAIPTGAPWCPMLRFDIRISASPQALDTLAPAGEPVRWALERDLERHLPPWIETVWLDPATQELPPAAWAMLEEALRTERDQNLGSRPEEFDACIAGSDWPGMCAIAAAKSLETVAGRPSVQRRFAAAAAEFASRRDMALAQREARMAHFMGDSEDPLRDAFDAVLAAALAHPTFAIESCGVVFLGPVGGART